MPVFLGPDPDRGHRDADIPVQPIAAYALSCCQNIDRAMMISRFLQTQSIATIISYACHLWRESHHMRLRFPTSS